MIDPALARLHLDELLRARAGLVNAIAVCERVRAEGRMDRRTRRHEREVRALLKETDAAIEVARGVIDERS